MDYKQQECVLEAHRGAPVLVGVTWHGGRPAAAPPAALEPLGQAAPCGPQQSGRSPNAQAAHE